MKQLLKNNWLTVVLIVAVTVAVYAQSLGNFFVDWDDYKLILNNLVLRQLTLKNIWLMFTTYDPELYIPFTLLSYHVDRLLAGGEFHHVVTHSINLLLHLGNAFLVCFIARLLSGSRWLGTLVGLLFAVHPLNTEAVVWASARKDLLSSLFCLWSLALYLRYLEAGERRDYKRSIILFACSLLAKVSTVVLPVVLLLTDWLYGRPLNKQMFKEKAPYFALSIVFGIIAMVGKPGREALYFEKILIGARSVWLYLQHLLVPTDLALLYPFTESISLRNPELLWSLTGVAAVTLLCIAVAGRTRWPLWAWGTFLLFLAPSFQNFTKGSYYLLDVYIGSDRYAYLAMVSVLIAVAMAARRLGTRAALPVLAVVAVFGYLAHEQSLKWHDTGTLFVNVMEHYPNSHVAHMNVGVVLKNKGHVDLAIERFRESNRIRPNEMAYFNLAQIELERGNSLQAKVYFARALEANPYHAITKINLAPLLLNEGRVADAKLLLDEAELLEPDNSTLLYNKGVVLETMGQTAEALEYYRKALEIVPDDEEIRRKIEALQG